MIGFSIMMWFVAIVLLSIGIALLSGNHSFMHGKVYDATQDKAGYAKATGKPALFIGIMIAISGICAILLPGNTAILVAVAIIIVAAVVGIIWGYIVSRHF